MKNINIKRLASILMVALLTSSILFTACQKDDDADTNQMQTGKIALNVYGPVPAMRGGELRFIGTNLNKVSQIDLPGAEGIKDINQINKNEIRILIPQTAEPGFITLHTPDGEIVTKTEISFTEPISFDKFTPAVAKAGQTITIEGDYLNTVEEIIFADDVHVLKEDFVSQTRKKIEVKVPLEAQTGEIIVSDGLDLLSDGDEMPNWVYSEESLEVLLPTYTKSEPGTLKAGEEIVFAGTDLYLVEFVKFSGDVIDGDFSLSEDNTGLTIKTKNVAGDGEIVFVTYSGIEIPAGSVSFIKPTELTVEQDVVKNGESITINGVDLDLVKYVEFINVDDVIEVKTLGKFSDTEIVIDKLPELAQSGDVKLILFNGDAVTTKFSALKPTIVSFSENPILAKEELLITGTDIDLVAEVIFKGDGKPSVIISSAEFVDATTLKIVVPEVAESCNPQLVMKNGEVVETEVELAIIPLTDPAIAVMPKNGQLNKFITITGRNFNYVESVWIGESKIVQYSDRSDTELTFRIPKDAETGEFFIKMINVEGNEFFSLDKIEILPTIITIWEGSFDITGWGGIQDLAWGGYDWSAVEAGQILHFTFTVNENEEWACISLRHGPDWGHLPDPTPTQFDFGPEDVTFAYTLSQSDVDDLIANNGLVVTGTNLIITSIGLE